MNTKTAKILAVLMILAVSMAFVPQNANASWWNDLWNWFTGQSTCPSCDESVSNTSDHQAYCGTCGIDYYTCGEEVHGSNCDADKETCPSCDESVSNTSDHQAHCGTCDIDYYTCGEEVHGSNCDAD